MGKFTREYRQTTQCIHHWWRAISTFEFKKFVQDCVEGGHAEHIDLRFNTNGQILDNELKDRILSLRV